MGSRATIPYELRSADGPPAFRIDGTGRAEIAMNWWMLDGRKGGRADKVAFLESFTRLYRGSRYLVPAFTVDRKVVHSLMAWWAVLFTLSMLARTSPTGGAPLSTSTPARMPLFWNRRWPRSGSRFRS